MKAVVVEPGVKNSVRVAEVPVPAAAGDEVLVKSTRVGVDGTDKEINAALYGEPPEGEDYLVLGHEAVGRVVEVGASVQGFSVGDLVVPTVRRPDDCPYCQAGQNDVCIKGDYKERGIKGLHGYMSEFFAESTEWLVRVPEELERTAVLLEPLSVVEKGIRVAWKAQERMAWQPKVALVTGVGPLGFLASLVLATMGLDVHAYSMEREDDFRVGLLRQVGVRYISARDVELEEVPSLVGENVDFIFEATGNSVVALGVVPVLGSNGALCLTGVTGGHKNFTLCADCFNIGMVLKNKLMFGTVNANVVDFKRGVEHMGKIEAAHPGLLERIITRRLSIDEEDAIRAAMSSPAGVKTVVEFGGREV
ncbi:MAG: glucose 1-dehydrogenase [Promethearchaeota archaeon]